MGLNSQEEDVGRVMSVIFSN